MDVWPNEFGAGLWLKVEEARRKFVVRGSVCCLALAGSTPAGGGAAAAAKGAAAAAASQGGRSVEKETFVQTAQNS